MSKGKPTYQAGQIVKGIATGVYVITKVEMVPLRNCGEVEELTVRECLPNGRFGPEITYDPKCVVPANDLLD